MLFFLNVKTTKLIDTVQKLAHQKHGYRERQRCKATTLDRHAATATSTRNCVGSQFTWQPRWDWQVLRDITFAETLPNIVAFQIITCTAFRILQGIAFQILQFKNTCWQQPHIHRKETTHPEKQKIDEKFKPSKILHFRACNLHGHF